MSIQLKLPVLSEGVESGDVLEVLVSQGEIIEKNQGIIELETDKATVTVPAEQAGVVSEIHVAEGDTISVGDLIISVEPAASLPADQPAETQPQPAPHDPTVPSAIDGKSQTSELAAANPVTPIPPSPAEPTVTPIAPVPPATPVPAKTPLQPVPAKSLALESDLSHVAAGPAIRRLAREVGIDLRTVQGSGEHGRITRDDVMQAVRGNSRKVAAANGAPAGLSDAYGPIRLEKMSKIRQTIAHKMHESWQTVARVTNFDDADVTDLENIRQSSKVDYASRGVKLTTMPFLIKAVAMALKSHSIINASLDLENGQVIYKDYINIGIAVDTERGLVVPVLRNADQLAIPDIARKLSQMAESVRNNDFSIEDLRGGSFTISNLGAIGGTYSTPIINTPETCILLIGRSRQLPVVIQDAISIRLMMPLSISYDHRLIDGGAAARFLNDVINYLEAPSRLLLAL